ncbi:YkvA family protein [Dactylosporangium sp. NPDC048998]|uniref:YkvA family protein n=1 Tax=Dactylosporangium sp. NPDC048998 TaxID=3363976 RepID=UPI003720607B
MALIGLLRLFKPSTPGVRRRLAALPRMIAATRRGEYDGGFRLVTMGLAAVYLISPLDLIADVVFLIVGVVGAGGLTVWLTGALLEETERFLEWERQRDLARRRAAPFGIGRATTTAARPTGGPRPRPAGR